MRLLKKIANGSMSSSKKGVGQRCIRGRSTFRLFYSRFLDVSPSTLSDRKTNKTNMDKPIKAKAKGIKGKIYRATFTTREVS